MVSSTENESASVCTQIASPSPLDNISQLLYLLDSEEGLLGQRAHLLRKSCESHLSLFFFFYKTDKTSKERQLQHHRTRSSAKQDCTNKHIWPALWCGSLSSFLGQKAELPVTVSDKQTDRQANPELKHCACPPSWGSWESWRSLG